MLSIAFSVLRSKRVEVLCLRIDVELGNFWDTDGPQRHRTAQSQRIGFAASDSFYCVGYAGAVWNSSLNWFEELQHLAPTE